MVSGEWLVKLPKQAVWELLTKPQHLIHSIENVVESDVLSEQEFKLTINVDTGVGSVKYKFVVFLEVAGDDEFVVRASGVNAHNIVEFNAKIFLSQRDSDTQMSYEINALARGGLASVAQRTVSDVITRHVKSWLEQIVQVEQVSI